MASSTLNSCFFSLCSAGRTEEALECGLTYLLFHEGEEFMTENVEYYKEVLGHDGQARKVRHDSARCRKLKPGNEVKQSPADFHDCVKVNRCLKWL